MQISRFRDITHRSIGLLGFFFSLLLVSSLACNRTAPKPKSSEPERLKVIASTFAMADLARQIGGKYVTVEWIVESGQSLNQFSPSGELRLRLDSADLLILNGASEPWATGNGDSQFLSSRLLRFDLLAASVDAPSATSPATLPATSPALRSTPNVSSDSDLVGAGYAWLNPQVARAACTEIARQFSIRRPTHDIYFQSQAQRLSEAIGIQDRQNADAFAALSPGGKTVLGMTGEFDPLAEHYGIKVDHTVLADQIRMSDALVRRLTEAATTGGGRVVLVPADAVAAQAAELSRRTTLQATLLDPFGSPSIPERAGYVELLKYNATTLLNALKR